MPPFYGNDYNELFDAYGLELCPDEEVAEMNIDDLEDYRGKAIKEFFNWIMMISAPGLRFTGPGPQIILQVAAFDLRLFLIELADQLDSGWGYHGPVFRGIAQVEDDWSMLQIAVPLITCMWS